MHVVAPARVLHATIETSGEQTELAARAQRVHVTVAHVIHLPSDAGERTTELLGLLESRGGARVLVRIEEHEAFQRGEPEFEGGVALYQAAHHGEHPLD